MAIHCRKSRGVSGGPTPLFPERDRTQYNGTAPKGFKKGPDPNAPYNRFASSHVECQYGPSTPHSKKNRSFLVWEEGPPVAQWCGKTGIFDEGLEVSIVHHWSFERLRVVS